MGDDLREITHSIVAKGLFVSNRSCPDVLPTISVLSSRVRSPNQSDWVKCRRFVKYLDSTKDLHMVLHYDGTSIARWHVDAAYGVHQDFCSHSGGTLLMHESGGGMASGSNKQRLNTRSSTIAELVAVDDFLGKLLWVKKFLDGLGYPLRQNILLQDNTSAILMEKNGRACLGKQNRAIDVHYFAIKDVVD